jgi:hypothetical protein
MERTSDTGARRDSGRFRKSGRQFERQGNHVIADKARVPIALAARTLEHRFGTIRRRAAPCFQMLVGQQTSRPVTIAMRTGDQITGEHEWTSAPELLDDASAKRLNKQQPWTLRSKAQRQGCCLTEMPGTCHRAGSGIHRSRYLGSNSSCWTSVTQVHMSRSPPNNRSRRLPNAVSIRPTSFRLVRGEGVAGTGSVNTDQVSRGW